MFSFKKISKEIFLHASSFKKKKSKIQNLLLEKHQIILQYILYFRIWLIYFINKNHFEKGVP